jgi:DNA segregation ATPase FtsK/SpoIIIE, S-DNA-T family
MIYQNFTNFLKNRTLELIGLCLVFVAILFAASFLSYSPSDPTFLYGAETENIQNLLGLYGGIISDFLLQSFGLTSFLILLTIMSWGLNLVIKKELKKIKYKIFYLFLYIIFSCLFIYATYNNSFWLIDNGNSGFVGEIIFQKISNLIPALNHEYSVFTFLILSIIFFILASSFNLKYLLSFPKFIISFFKNKKNLTHDIKINSTQSTNVIFQEADDDKSQQAFSFAKKVEVKERIIKNENLKNFKLPSLDLLEKNPSRINLLDLSKNRPEGSFIEKILLDFGIDGKITKINNGPVVSLYEFEPAPGVKVSKIINLSDDLARNTSSTSARVSIIPGKNTVGIEIPNQSRESVYLKEILENEKFQKKDIKLPIAIGKSISGLPIVGDLTAMPHLLIAGTTGSGKSVCINTIIVSLLYRLSPELCKFILIDPKMLELSSYEGIPHLLSPVITDSKKAASALGWTVREMNNRYKLMSKEGVRNIDGYNAKHKLKMPYIVVVVDEMSDLMLVAGKEIENYIQKLSQMARAAGIHIIMATQRPSVDVITGTIKANFPTRISFRVSSKIDSRTILGEQGAEQLLGNGDMLFMSSANRIVRIHGPYVSEKEIEKITNILRAQGEPDFIEEITTNEKSDNIDDLSDDDVDELYDQALNIIKTEGKASTSFLQRKLQIGYNRAARIIDMMEEKGIVSKANHVGKREVL